MTARAAAVIPARYASTRFPGKPLADLTGKPMILHVLERAAQCRTVSRIVVATDDDRIHRVVLAAGFESRMTRADHPNGTCRIAEVADALDEPLIVNIQGDEPQIEPELVDRTVELLASRPDVPMATLVSPFAPGEDPANPNIVKCVRAVDGRALYFSRSLVPFDRDRAPGAAAPMKHVGLYVYRREFLRTFIALAPTPLERTESLEQLRVLEHGHAILCAEGEVEKKVSMKPAPPVDGRYVSLGEFQFETNVGHVIVSNEGTTGHVTADAVVFVPTDKKAPTSSTGEDQLAALRRELNELKARGPERPRSMGVREREKISDARVHIRGQVGSLGAVVPRGALQVISVPTPGIPAGQSGRLQLAEWITHPDHPLTARVMANRVWHWLFGAGLVRSVDNFGSTGDPPSHPELLDHLASRFMADGWSLKKMVRSIVLSKTYGQASGVAHPADPDNRLLSHANRRRLDAECIRDAMLVAGNNLDIGGYGGPGFGKAESDYSFTTDARVRSLYLPVLRNVADPCLEVFDRADPSRVVGARDTSTVAPQALFLLNNPLVASQARLAAGRVLANPALADDAERRAHLWRLVLGRPP